MPRKKRVNILRLNIDAAETFTESICDERLLILPTSVTGWRIGIGPKDVESLRVALDNYELSAG